MTIFLLGGLLAAGAGGRAGAMADGVPTINSLTVAGTNLVFDATFPAGVLQANLQMRANLTDDWMAAGAIAGPTNGGEVVFREPRPHLSSAFFRIQVTFQAAAQALAVSSEVRYVAGPPLTRRLDGDGRPEAVFHFQGLVDGSDRIRITRQGALWEHVNWGWPGAVNVNGVQWVPSEKNFLTTTGLVSFLPEQFSLAEARLEVNQGRDIVAVERTNDALLVYLDDTPAGAARYEFEVHFPEAGRTRWATPAGPAATLKIRAQIDGSDRLKITAGEAKWTHLAYSRPWAVMLNGVSWDLAQTNVLANTGTNTFLPPGVDFTTARIVHRSGRDLATMRADRDAVWVTFGDNPIGADAYELEIQFGGATVAGPP